MKKFFAVVLAAGIVAACNSPKGANAQGDNDSTAVAQTAKVDVKSLLPSKAEVDSVSYLIGVNFGSFIKNYNFGDVNYAQLKKGIEDFIKAKGDFRDPEFGKQFKIDPNTMNDLFNAFLEKRQKYTLAVNKEKGEKFLAENAKKEGVVVSDSGLQYIIEEAGSDVKAGPKDTVKVNYKGTLLDGTVFDETKGEPVQLMLNRVIPGWTEGIQLVGEGGKIKLFIPAELAYGERGQQGIEPNSTLLFDVEVVEVHPFVEKEETK